MSRNRFYQAKKQTTTTKISSLNHLTTTKAHQLFLDDNDNIDMRKKCIIKNLHPPIDLKDAVKKYCDQHTATCRDN